MLSGQCLALKLKHPATGGRIEGVIDLLVLLHSSFLILFLLCFLFHCMLQVFPAIFTTLIILGSNVTETRILSVGQKIVEKVQERLFKESGESKLTLISPDCLFTLERRKRIPWMTNTNHVPSFDMTKSTLDRSSWSSLWICRASVHLSRLWISIHDVPSVWLEKGTATHSSVLEIPMDRGAWRATVHGVAKNWTWLSDFHFHFLCDDHCIYGATWEKEAVCHYIPSKYFSHGNKLWTKITLHRSILMPP